MFYKVVTTSSVVLYVHIQKREQQKLLEGGVDIFPMREIQDLSARDSELLLLEYCEEHPPLLSQPGMASRIKNYYKRVCFVLFYLTAKIICSEGY